METRQELEQWLARLEAKWANGNFGDPHEIIRLAKQIKELRKKIQAF